MNFISAIPVIGSLVDSISKGLDELFTSDEEQGRIDIEKKRLELQRLVTELKAQHAQLQINMVQANHPSLFVAGARPAIIWIGAVGLAYEAIFRPFLNGIWTALYKPAPQEIISEAVKKFGDNVSAVHISTLIKSYEIAFPSIETDLFMPIVLGVLGIGGMRSWEKITGKARNNMGAPAASLEIEKMLAEQLDAAKKEKERLETTTVEESMSNVVPSGNESIDKYREAAQSPDYKPKQVHFDEIFEDP